MSTGVTLEHEAAAGSLVGDTLIVARAGQKFRVDANSRKEILDTLGDFPLEDEGGSAWLITCADVIRANLATTRIDLSCMLEKYLNVARCCAGTGLNIARCAGPVLHSPLRGRPGRILIPRTRLLYGEPGVRVSCIFLAVWE